MNLVRLLFHLLSQSLIEEYFVDDVEHGHENQNIPVEKVRVMPEVYGVFGAPNLLFQRLLTDFIVPL